MISLTSERLRSVLSYDPTTGIWTWLQTLAPRGKVGSQAGYKSPSGYRQIRIDGHLFRSSRLAWFYMTGKWPSDLLDHKNLDRADDRWLNLREATGTQNNANVARRRKNVSGYKGVSWNRLNSTWTAYLHVHGKTRNLGSFNTKEAAHARYCEVAKEVFGEFARAA